MPSSTPERGRSLGDLRPDLAAELVDKDLAFELTTGSSKKVAWCCSHNHTWNTVVHKRTSGQGCPYCCNNKVWPGFNDMLTTHPDLAAELVDEALATQLVAGSNKIVDWRCSRGHTWKAAASKRLSGQGCPFCGNRRVLKGFNDLATVNPNLAAQLVDETVGSQVTAGSKKTVAWRCDRSHEWEAKVGERSQGTGCPYCTNRRVLIGFNDLATTHPDLALQLVDQSRATQFTGGSVSEETWRCDLDHEWRAPVYQRSAGNGCPFCANKRVWLGFNDLRTVNPDLAAQLKNQDLAGQLVPGSSKKVDWRCEMGHVWEASVASRTNGSGCPTCSLRYRSVGQRDQLASRPDLVAQLLDQSLAEQVTLGSQRKVAWRCSKGHVWDAVVASRASGNGCPYCSNKKVLPGYNDLATVHPRLAAQLVDQKIATAVTSSAKRTVEWQCHSGHKWSAPVYARTAGTDCPQCSGRVPIVGVNDLATLLPELAAQLVDQSLSTQLMPQSSKKVEWQCSTGHRWLAKVDNRTNGRNCPICSNKQVLVGYNDLRTVRPSLAAELVDQSLATTLVITSNKRVEWRCSEGHTWITSVASRSSGSGCSDCAEYGIDYSAPGAFYVVASDDVLKCGISNANSLKGRLNQHRTGIYRLDRVLGKRHFSVTSDAREMELVWIAFVRQNHLGRIGNHKEYVYLSDHALNFALELLRTFVPSRYAANAPSQEIDRA